MDGLVLVMANLMALAALFWLFDSAYRAYRLDLLRHQLFRARDALFDAAADGALSFEDKAYGMTRQMLNGMIRFAHNIGFWRSVVLFFGRRWFINEARSERFAKQFGEAVGQLHPSGKRAVLEAVGDMHVAVLSYTLHTSIILFPVAIVGQAVLGALLHMRRLRRKLRNAIPIRARHALDCHVYEIGAECI